MGERLVDDVVDFLDCGARETGVQALAVETLEVEGIEVLELDSSCRRLDVVGHEVLISRERRLPDRAAPGVGEPAVEVLA